jgi:hypothetical protein
LSFTTFALSAMPSLTASNTAFPAASALSTWFRTISTSRSRMSRERLLDLAGADDLARVRRARDALEPPDIRISGQSATAVLESGRRLRLEHSGAGWLVDDPRLR